MSRETTDILYIDLDYYTPVNYYVYTAEAAVVADGYINDDYFVYDYFVTQGGTSSLTCELTQVVGETVTGSGTLSSSASLTVSVAVTRSTSVTLNSSFTQTATGEKTLEISATLNANFTQTSSGEVTRGFGAGLNASATITCSNFRVRPGLVDLSGAFNASITCVATKTGDILLQSQFTQSATGSRTRTTTSTLDASATQTVTAGRLLESTATLNSTATLSATPINLLFADATLASSASIAVDGFITGKRPRNYTYINTPTFTTTEKWGTYAIEVGYDGTNNNQVQWYASDDWLSWRTMDFWVWPSAGFAATFDELDIYTQLDDANNSIRVLIFQNGAANNYKLQIIVRNGGTQTLYESANYVWSGYKHIRIVRHSGGFDLWVDGTLDSPTSDTSVETLPSLTSAPLLGRSRTNETAEIYLDEFYLTTATLTSAGTGSFTVPSDRWYLDASEQANAIVLNHFENSADDDLAEAQRTTATLNSTATLSSDVSRIRTGSSSLSSTATLSAAIGIIKPLSSSMNSTATLLTAVGEIQETIIVVQGFATLSVEIGLLQDASATLNSAATLTATGQDFDFAEASLSSSFAVTAQLDKRFRPKGYVEWSNSIVIDGVSVDPIDIDPYNTFPLEGWLKIPAAGIINSTYPPQYAEVFSDDTVLDEYGYQLLNNDSWTIELLHASINSQAWGGANDTSIINIPGKLRVSLKGTLDSGNVSSTMYVRYGTNTWSVSMDSSSQSYAYSPDSEQVGGVIPGPNWIALSYDTPDSSGRLQVFVNGTRVLNQTGLSQLGATTGTTVRLGADMGANKLAFPGYTDELRLSNTARYNGSTITLATERTVDNELIWFGYDSNVIGHFRFNNFSTNAPVLDEISIGENGIKNATATLNSSFSAVGTITGPQRLPATTVSSQASLSAEGVVTLEGVSTLNSSATLSVPQSEIIIFLGAVLPAQASLTADVGRIRQGAATLDSNADFSALGGLIRSTSATLDAQFTQSSSGDRTRTADSTVNSTVTMSATGQRIRFADSTQDSQATLSADPTGTFELSAQLDSLASVNADNIRVRFADANISGAFNATMTVNAILRPDVYLSTAVTASIDAVKTTDTGATLDVEAGFTVQTLKVVGFEASINAQFGITIDNQVIKAVGADLEGVFAQTTTTDNSKTAGFEAQFDSEFTSSADVNRTRPGVIVLDVGTALVAGGARFVGADSTLNSTTSLSINAGKIVDIDLELVGFFSTLTAGDVINIDPFRTLTVPQENRLVQVLAENRTVIVEQETRVNTLL